MNITVDTQACGDAESCGRCLQRCPEKVFAMVPIVHRAHGVRAERWSIRSLVVSECSGCGDCLSFCPKGALALH